MAAAKHNVYEPNKDGTCNEELLLRILNNAPRIITLTEPLSSKLLEKKHNNNKIASTTELNVERIIYQLLPVDGEDTEKFFFVQLMPWNRFIFYHWNNDERYPVHPKVRYNNLSSLRPDPEPLEGKDETPKQAAHHICMLSTTMAKTTRVKLHAYILIREPIWDELQQRYEYDDKKWKNATPDNGARFLTKKEERFTQFKPPAPWLYRDSLNETNQQWYLRFVELQSELLGEPEHSHPMLTMALIYPLYGPESPLGPTSVELTTR